jgi:hypothetical protein
MESIDAFRAEWDTGLCFNRLSQGQSKWDPLKLTPELTGQLGCVGISPRTLSVAQLIKDEWQRGVAWNEGLLVEYCNKQGQVLAFGICIVVHDARGP